ncbi:PREDICTED: cytochrome b5-like [Papilio xuthus]|uniref:Cytochrome b5 n=1 Tax=Papilio xuthus TaxID=66420 RepID=I4DJN2_PAPXU|nr:cytochrome b5-like [Papilio xuthus]XP_013177284.1 PREDICTED: cytochrome b5-like [Papilio xuthus]KPJ00364.1 Cytochrome b5 [Papilio xuthus]BAM18122.1 cytochrome B5 [Papilio xuthus]
METKKFTRKEIAERDTKAETVFVIANKVYDVTKFVDDHPGGHEILVNVAGKDASEQFEDAGHSLDAKELMQKYYIGELVEQDKRQVIDRNVNWNLPPLPEESASGFFSSWKFPAALGLVLTLLYTYLFG